MRKALALLIVSLLPWPSAYALCSYHGVMYAKTTAAQEYADADWVVHVRVMAADEHWSDDDDSWTIYHLKVLQSFKGKAAAKMQMFTYRDSGGFYLDKGMYADLGDEYLLYLDAIPERAIVPRAAHGATEVNYACGQSKLWSQTTSTERMHLIKMAQRKH